MSGSKGSANGPATVSRSQTRTERIAWLAVARLGRLRRRFAAAACSRSTTLHEVGLRSLGGIELRAELGAGLVVLRRRELAEKVVHFLRLLGELSLELVRLFGLLHERRARGGFACVVLRLDLAEVQKERADEKDRTASDA